MNDCFLIMCMYILYLCVFGSSDTYLLREERDNLSADGTETFDNLRLRWKERETTDSETEGERRGYMIVSHTVQ